MLLQSDSLKTEWKTERERHAGRLTVDQSRESREEQSHWVPHPGGVEGVKERRQKKRSFRCWKKEEEGGKGKGGYREEGRKGAETQEAAGNPPVCIQSASEGRSASVCWKKGSWERASKRRRRRCWLCSSSSRSSPSLSLSLWEVGLKWREEERKCQWWGERFDDKTVKCGDGLEEGESLIALSLWGDLFKDNRNWWGTRF